jgi:uncharacterized protein YjbJ (UPF0337 family)
MNTLQIKGNWNILKGRFRQKYGNILHNEEQFVTGKHEERFGKLQHQWGKTQAEYQKRFEKVELA